MKVVRINAGLGNALFQYALYLQIKKMYPNEECFVDTLWYDITDYPYELETVFNIKLPNIRDNIKLEFIADIDEFIQNQKEWLKQGFNSYIKAIGQNSIYATFSADRSWVEIPEFYNEIGYQFQIRTNPKLKMRMDDWPNFKESQSHRKSYLGLLSSIKNHSPQLYNYLRIFKNLNVRKKAWSEYRSGKQISFTASFDFEVLNSKGDTYFGLYGHPDICYENEEQLKETLHFPLLDKDNDAIKNAMAVCNSVSLHARVVDFNYGIGFLLKKGYYQKCVAYIKKKVDQPVFYVFSDNLNWCKENLSLLGLDETDDIVFVEGNNGANSYKDMQLMSYCKHNIVPNSTFSWWAAFLNLNPDKIVCTPYGTLPGSIYF